MKFGASKLWAATAALLIAASGASAQTVLRYSNWLPPTHTLKKTVFEPWAEEVAKVTNGRVKVDMLPKVVGSVPGQLDVVRDGQADVSWIVNGYTPGRFTLSEIAELPFMGDDAEVTSPTFHRFYERHLAKYGEFKGVHVLSTFPVGSGHIFLAKKQFRAIGDLKGMKMRNPQGSTLPIMAALGAVPVQKPVTEMYELLSSGVVDGSFLNREAVYGYKLLDALPHLTLIPGGIYNTVLSLVINEKKWNEISEADRRAIMGISGEALATSIGKAYNRIDGEGVDALRKNGGTIEVASPQLMADLKSTLRPVEQAWIDAAKKKGMADADKMLEEYRAMLAEAAKNRQARK
ncbi:MAG: TRAP transporter substrate-binding protein [Hydrogenophaga sp.]|uniref:TRAP transporter substrate-binding protein n=1 Tax=Hydrogenophaga sp. TaxID=1904254 RepID=UPI003D0B8BD0